MWEKKTKKVKGIDFTFFLSNAWEGYLPTDGSSRLEEAVQWLTIIILNSRDFSQILTTTPPPPHSPYPISVAGPRCDGFLHFECFFCLTILPGIYLSCKVLADI